MEKEIKSKTTPSAEGRSRYYHLTDITPDQSLCSKDIQSPQHDGTWSDNNSSAMEGKDRSSRDAVDAVLDSESSVQEEKCNSMADSVGSTQVVVSSGSDIHIDSAVRFLDDSIGSYNSQDSLNLLDVDDVPPKAVCMY